MARKSPYPAEMRVRAVRMVGEVRPNYDSEFAAIKAVAARLGVGSAETLRKWVRRAEVDAGTRPGITTGKTSRSKALKREVAELSFPGGRYVAPIASATRRASPEFSKPGARRTPRNRHLRTLPGERPPGCTRIPRCRMSYQVIFAVDPP